MKFSCPICDTSIEVSKFLVGQKGRCPRCSSKFLVPESENDEIEILERGEIPEDGPEPEPVPEPAPPAKAEPKKPAAPATPPKVSTKPAAAAGSRIVVPATGAAPARTAARPVVVKQSSGAFGFLFAIVLAALVGVVVYVMMEREKNRQAAAAKAAEPKIVKVIEKPVRPRQPVVPVVEPDEPEPEGIPVFAKVIQPVLEAKCVSCHGAEKRKGRLAMHTFEALAAGSGNGPIVEADADDANRIELIFRAELPETDDEHMPPQGKPQLTPEELAIIKWWIKEGAHEDIESNEAPDDIRQKIEGLATL